MRHKSAASSSHRWRWSTLDNGKCATTTPEATKKTEVEARTAAVAAVDRSGAAPHAPARLTIAEATGSCDPPFRLTKQQEERIAANRAEAERRRKARTTQSLDDPDGDGFQEEPVDLEQEIGPCAFCAPPLPDTLGGGTVHCAEMGRPTTAAEHRMAALLARVRAKELRASADSG